MDSSPALTLVAGRYRLGAVLGRGGMAEVWAADDVRLDRPVAVKMLRAELAADPSIRLRFEDEARAAARVGHPSVVAIYDTGEHEGIPYIVMERLAGRSLADELRDGPATVDRTCAVAGHVLGALQAAHAAGVVHRDIKPANVLLAERDEVKVADFGIATIAERAAITSTGLVVGTASYLAPERIAGSPATPASDLYSVGVLLYEMLTGRVPCSGDTPLAVLDAIRQGRMQSLREARPDVDPLIATAVERAMDREPERRYPSARAMADAIRSPTGPPPTERADAPTTVSPGAGSATAVSSPAAPSPTRVLSISPPPPGAGLRQVPRGFVAAIVAGVAMVVVVAAITLTRHDSTPAGDSSPSTTSPSQAGQSNQSNTPSTVPDPLAKAIDELQRAIHP